MQIPAVTSVNPIVAADPAFKVPGIGSDAIAPSSGAGSGFGAMLSNQLATLNATQNQAAAQSQALATGQAQDVTSVVADVEKAALQIQLATQVRNKAVDAYNEIFRMQI